MGSAGVEQKDDLQTSVIDRIVTPTHSKRRGAIFILRAFRNLGLFRGGEGHVAEGVACCVRDAEKNNNIII